ncbi:hypothetical protein BRUC_2534 [Brucella melitensis]
MLLTRKVKFGSEIRAGRGGRSPFGSMRFHLEISEIIEH